MIMARGSIIKRRSYPAPPTVERQLAIFSISAWLTGRLISLHGSHSFPAHVATIARSRITMWEVWIYANFPVIQ